NLSSTAQLDAVSSDHQISSNHHLKNRTIAHWSMGIRETLRLFRSHVLFKLESTVHCEVFAIIFVIEDLHDHLLSMKMSR
ncbi:hypothetical protein PENTCL1PPCAC_29245, partial [Pristionchus entomophagus]